MVGRTVSVCGRGAPYNGCALTMAAVVRGRMANDRVERRRLVQALERLHLPTYIATILWLLAGRGVPYTTAKHLPPAPTSPLPPHFSPYRYFPAYNAPHAFIPRLFFAVTPYPPFLLSLLPYLLWLWLHTLRLSAHSLLRGKGQNNIAGGGLKNTLLHTSLLSAALRKNGGGR